jgi:hypothetical protein
MDSSALRRGSGLLVGGGLAPLTAFASALRRSRVFHPRGVCYSAQVEVATDDVLAAPVASRISGTALVRLSTAWWKTRQWPDVLGLAIRFAASPLSPEKDGSAQDLLFATIRRPWTLPFAPLATRVQDFLDNHYYAVSPFAVRELGSVELRVVPQSPSPAGKDREARLRAAVHHGGARLVLEWAPYRKPWQLFDDRGFRPLVRLSLTGVVDTDQRALLFHPFRAGRGIVPVGFIQWLRLFPYSSSQRARPRGEPADARTRGASGH